MGYLFISFSGILVPALLLNETCKTHYLHEMIMLKSLSIYSLGNLSKTCTVHGWPPSSLDSYIMDCGYNPNSTVEGHSVSLASCIIW